jgi:arylsulfatase
MADKPNILLITTDTHRWDALECMGGVPGCSPNLDRLAAQGVLFEQAHSSCPVCMPARSSLLCGVHAPVHGAIENGFDRLNHLTTYPDLLTQQGYRCGIVGKTHMGPVPESFVFRRETHGEKNQGNSTDWWSQHLEARGLTRQAYGWKGASYTPNPIPEEDLVDTLITDHSIAAIDELGAGDAPWFVHCSMISPHAPIDPVGRWAELAKDIPLPPVQYEVGEIDRLPAHHREVLQLTKRLDDWGFKADGSLDHELIDQVRRAYYALCAYCDHQIGRLLDHLEERGERDNTLVIFTSDHGITMFEHGLFNKHTFFDASWRVPLIMAWPQGIAAGQRREFALTHDITATMLAAAGTSCDTMQGFDLLAADAGNTASTRTCALAVLYKNLGLATTDWKLDLFPEEDCGRLYHRSDERCDLWNRPAHRELRDGLVAAVLAWRSELWDYQELRARSHGGGPIAMRLKDHLNSASGLDAERRLQRRVAQVLSTAC